MNRRRFSRAFSTEVRGLHREIRDEHVQTERALWGGEECLHRTGGRFGQVVPRPHLEAALLDERS